MSGQVELEPLASELGSNAVDEVRGLERASIRFHEDGKNLARAKTDSNLQARLMVRQANHLFGETVASMKMLQDLRASLRSFDLPSPPKRRLLLQPFPPVPDFSPQLLPSKPSTADERTCPSAGGERGENKSKTRASAHAAPLPSAFNCGTELRAIVSSPCRQRHETSKSEKRLRISRPATSLGYSSLPNRLEEQQDRPRPASAMESEERSEPDQLLNVMGYLPPSNDRQLSSISSRINPQAHGHVFVMASRLKITPGSIVRHKPQQETSTSPPTLINSLHTTSVASRRVNFNEYLRVASAGDSSMRREAARGRQPTAKGSGGNESRRVKTGMLDFARRKQLDWSWSSTGPRPDLSMDFHVQSPNSSDELRLEEHHAILRHYTHT
ncbi:hypothetical protein GUITHDRAFT_106942 [Guillardia theta CCMP2712]|uniref:Uncharacterized protein n=1 Tax=Guillardia theta (strain CCMP2712) TaxID=905079 RepID=L1JFW0_GUITC|nr:hypothetical protein GUITHDRAFT_106942 [Guillardia theta CCMP2712]EKX47029.1 hypothetical protein GUITHDRAFT_106942 [Guillardia theta CCMP2712]|eukprot:XP_005834009.1 hypothetical protein GUITHDRAFT_106942 [Guillardia theta CCMP2712]